MRNYWMRILIGAVIIFAVGMLGVTLVRHGMVRVNDVVHGSGPISIPLAIIPFEIGGNKLGTLDRLVLERTAPKNISSVRVEVKLDDSLVALGLSGCRLAANLDASHQAGHDLNVKLGKEDGGTFRCLSGDAADTSLVEFGRASLKPGGVDLPLYLPREMVEQLQRGDFLTDSADVADSVADAMEALGDSISEAQDHKVDSLNERNATLSDSLRAAGRRRIDSLKVSALRLADSIKAASLQENASRPR